MEKENILEEILKSSKDQETNLFRIARYIEEKNQISGNLNYWDTDLNSLDIQDKLFYKSWLWLSYMEAEDTILKPIDEIAEVFGEHIFQSISVLSSKFDCENDLEEEQIRLKGTIGKALLDWAKDHIK